jgi:hypothetical protein
MMNKVAMNSESRKEESKIRKKTEFELREEEKIRQLEKEILEIAMRSKKNKYVPVEKRVTLNLFGVDNRSKATRIKGFESQANEKPYHGIPSSSNESTLSTQVDWESILMAGQVKYDPSAFEPLVLRHFELGKSTMRIKESIEIDSIPGRRQKISNSVSYSESQKTRRVRSF